MNKPFDKYEYYTRAVQAPDTDVEFLYDTYKRLRKKRPTSMREDFCGTFALCCEWAKFKKENKAYGIDLDAEPIAYGQEHYWSKLSKDQQKRVTILNQNVLKSKAPPVDIIAAMNFSYFIFKKRPLLKKYFQSAYRGLKRDGIMIMDVFGGQMCEEANVDSRKVGNFMYYWHQDNYNPITHEAAFFIHFKRKGEKKRERVFCYDWRMWRIAELRDILEEVGFKKTTVYWEGTTRAGEGNGIFTESEVGDDAEAWVAYIAAEK